MLEPFEDPLDPEELVPEPPPELLDDPLPAPLEDPLEPEEPLLDPLDPEDPLEPEEPLLDPVDPEDPLEPEEPLLDPLDPEEPLELEEPVDPEEPLLEPLAVITERADGSHAAPRLASSAPANSSSAATALARFAITLDTPEARRRTHLCRRPAAAQHDIRRTGTYSSQRPGML